jgi:succinoglycan biosynthesis transport protein ExoP
MEAKYQSTKRAGVWLQDRIKELRDQASTAERAVVTYKVKNNIVDAGGRLMNEQQLAELNSQLVLARAQTSEANARLDRIEAVLKADSPTITVDATVADTLKNEVIIKLRTQYLELARREADWSARYGPNHLAVVNLRNQMREIRKSILDELRRTAETFKSDYEIAKQRQQNIEAALVSTVSESNVTNQARIEQRELESNAETYRALYDNFLQRYMESVQQQSFPITEARLITQASRPLRKSYPNPLLVIAITSLGGVMLGLGAGLLRDLWERVFRTGAQVESILQSNCLAVLPILKDGAAAQTASDSNGKRNFPGARNVVRGQGYYWHVVDSPLSRYTESIRSIKVAIDLYGVSKSNKVIGITSALPNEGKSTTAAALAELTSQAGAKTILVDCDFRHPSLTRAFAPDAKVGILELISGKATLEEVVWTDQSTKLTFLPAVVKSRFAHTSDILASAAIDKLFDRLKESFDYIVVDLSPLAPVVDVRTTTHFVDSYVLIVEWGRTNIDIVRHTLNEAKGVYENLLGVVLNKADVNVLSRYEGYRGGSHYYKKYYTRYGYSE